MTNEEAIKLVVHEGLTGESGVVVMVSMGEDPGRERMAALLEALEVVREELRGQAFLDRELAHVLFRLAFHVQRDVERWLSQGRVWREEFVDEEMVRMFELIESIFGDEAIQEADED